VQKVLADVLVLYCRGATWLGGAVTKTMQTLTGSAPTVACLTTSQKTSTWKVVDDCGSCS